MPNGILIVDDNADIRELLAMQLKGRAPIFTADCGHAAQAQLEHHRKIGKSLEVLITDINMPNGNGVELVHWVQNTFPESEKPKIIVISAEQEDWIAKLMRAGATVCLNKPFRQTDLLRILDNLLFEKLDYPGFVAQRRAPRFTSDLKVKIAGEKFARIQNISFVGMRLALDSINYNIGDEVDFEGLLAELPTSGRAVVRWISEQHNELGVEFRHPEEEAAANYLARFINRACLEAILSVPVSGLASSEPA